MAHIHEKARRSVQRGVLAEANHARLMDGFQAAGVTLDAFDAKILAWLDGRVSPQKSRKSGTGRHRSCGQAFLSRPRQPDQWASLTDRYPGSPSSQYVA
jgi:hypothetical protein